MTGDVAEVGWRAHIGEFSASADDDAADPVNVERFGLTDAIGLDKKERHVGSRKREQAYQI